MKKAVGYIRVSTHKQAKHGVSLEAQEAQIRAYCLIRDLELVEVIVDTVSAKNIKNRPAMKRMLNDAKAHRFDAIVTCKLDRLFRLTSDAITEIPRLQKMGVATHIIDFDGASIDTSTAMGMMFLTMMAAMAEMERNLIAERTTSALRHKRKQRQRYSNEPPYGWFYSNEGELAPLDRETRAVRDMLAMRATGISYNKIADAMTKKGHHPRRARIWSASTVRAICMHDLNQGEY